MHFDDAGGVFVLVQFKVFLVLVPGLWLFVRAWRQHIISGLLWCRIYSSSLHHLLWRYCCINTDPLTKYLLSFQNLGASFQTFQLKCSNVSDKIIISEGKHNTEKRSLRLISWRIFQRRPKLLTGRHLSHSEIISAALKTIPLAFYIPFL